MISQSESNIKLCIRADDFANQLLKQPMLIITSFFDCMLIITSTTEASKRRTHAQIQAISAASNQLDPIIPIN
jgi:hypothetical protein